MGKTIESKAAKTILQKPETIKVGNETFEVAPPSTATLILLSEAVSKLPNYKLDEDRLFTEVLATAQDCKPLGEIGAILILGAKRINERRKLFGIINRKSEKDRLSQKLLTDLTPRELNDVIAKILQSLEIGNFFGLTTSLTEVNLLRQTRGW